jgi:hypothetical protein
MGDFNRYNQNYDPGYSNYNKNYNQDYNQDYTSNSNSNLMSRNLTNHFYKLSTQSNLLIFGYILLMSVNHMILGDIIYDKENSFDKTKKIWFFSTVFFCTLINCFVLLLLKEKKRPVIQSARPARLVPILFGIFQIIILGFTLALLLTSTHAIDTKKKVITSITFVAINCSVILSTWGFASSVCSIDKQNGRRGNMF